MSDGSISQDEIDALLAGVDMGGMGAASPSPAQSLSDSQSSALEGFISGNIPSFKSNLDSMTGQKVDIGAPAIEIMKRDSMLRKIPEMVVGCVIDFNAGLIGDHLFVLAPEFAQKIVSHVNNEANAELDEMSLSVISETISQQVGIELTALEKAGFKGVANNPAESVHVPKAMIRFPQQDFCVITYPVTIEGSPFSLWEIIPYTMAVDIANAFGGAPLEAVDGMSGMGADPMASMGMGQMGGMQGQMGNMGMGQMGGMQGQMGNMGMQGQMGNMGMGQMGNMGGMQGQMGNMGMQGMQGMGQMGNMGNMGMGQMGGMQGQIMGMNPNVQPVQLPNLQMGSMGSEQGNIGLIMDVFMEMTVELGRTRKVIKEILGMGEGTIIELDKLAGEPVDILVNHKPIAKGEVVVIDENFGVRVTEILSPVERVSEM
ncbi:MAG TPA: flagellar motor switch protein FliN [Treponemataceae bacterium]|nr:flagellar motor switch protein FliN [Treponemataceae bacterium]